ncbi:MAG: type VI secretion system-associated protein TagF [Panacagrimonas sp.]
MNAAPATLPGWYGKLPFLGDFAGRRLPSSFVRAWDDWLQSVIFGSRALLRNDWMPRYLNSPIWRFCLAPGVCGNNAWFGLLMSSVDRANRHFPFTLAHGVAPENLHDLAFGSMTDWLSSLEPTLAAMLDLQGSVQGLEDRLLPLRPPGDSDETRPRPIERLQNYFDEVQSVPEQDIPALLAAIARTSSARGEEASLWWTGPDADGRCLVWACRGLPSAEDYSSMLCAG